MKEGVTGGPIPSLNVFEIGPLESRRFPSDILPYMPVFREYFHPLPTSPENMVLKSCKVPIANLECVTSTTVRVGGPTWCLNIHKGPLLNV